MPFGGLGRLGLRLSLVNTGDREIAIPVPTGDCPVLILFTDWDSRQAAAQVATIAKQLIPKLYVIKLDMQQSLAARTDRTAMRRLLAQTRAAAVLIMGSELPAALIVAATDTGVPMVMGNLRLDRQPRWLSLQRAIKGDLLSRMRRIFVTDKASLSIVRHMVGDDRVSLTGPIAETFEPLPHNEAERASLAALINGRHTWFAASVPLQEEKPVLEAHLAALRQTHLALLLMVPADIERADILAEQFESHGLIVARRGLDEEPTPEVQVLVADSYSELGLWYRLAPVTFLGGTLSGDDAQTRHPFEPAALGSAVVHGPRTTKYASEWKQLSEAGACRQVESGPQLSAAIAELSQPDLVAELASKASEVSTRGAGVAMQIALESVSDLKRGRV